MLLISCPYCGARDEIEFHAGGEAARQRPETPAHLDDRDWADFLFMRRNERGGRLERWNHAAGCRRWFNVRRDTVTHAITALNGVSGGAASASAGGGGAGAAGGSE